MLSRALQDTVSQLIPTAQLLSSKYTFLPECRAVSPHHGTSYCAPENTICNVLAGPWLRLYGTATHNKVVGHIPGIIGVELDQGIKIGSPELPDPLLDSILDAFGTVQDDLIQDMHITPVYCDRTLDGSRLG